MSVLDGSLIAGGVYRCPGRSRRYPLRKIVEIKAICGAWWISWEAVGGTHRGCHNEAAFASAAVERVA